MSEKMHKLTTSGRLIASSLYQSLPSSKSNMATRSYKMDRKRTRDNDENVLLIRAKGQYLRVPKEEEHKRIAGGSGADNLVKPKKRRKAVSRKEQRKLNRNEKKTKKSNFFHRKVKDKKQIIANKSEDTVNSQLYMGIQATSKKKKRKRKRKNSTPTKREIEIQRLKEENEKEEKEIKRLEKLLNINNKKKLPSQFKADGLDYLLEVCDPQGSNLEEDNDSEDNTGLQKYIQAFSRNQKGKIKAAASENKKTKRITKQSNSLDEESDLDDEDQIDDDDDDEWNIDDEGGSSTEDEELNEKTESKDKDVLIYDESDPDEHDNESVNESIDTKNNDKDSLIDGETEANDSEISNGKYRSDDDDENENDVNDNSRKSVSHDNNNTDLDTKERSDQNVPTDIPDGTTKYLPPHLRNKVSSDSTKEHLNKVRRQLKGLLNKLSERNLQVLCSEIEELFNHNSRNDMNELLTDLILDACVSSTLMPPKLLMEHCLLLAVLNSNIGMEIGAYFTQVLALRFDRLHKAGKNPNSGKEIFNILSLFSHLYNFKVISCGLIYDIIRRLSDGFQEQDIDLLLLMLKSTGAEIRRDDPGSLKDIILQIQAKAASASDLSNESRVRFMLEIISNLRNNNLRKIPGYDPSQVEHLRKLLRSVIRDYNGTSSSQLQMSLKDLLEVDTKGRWWVVGSAWSGRQISRDSAVTSTHIKWNSQLLELARKQRMNTDVRKNVFCIMMTSEDYIDAFEKLLRLNLKDVQAREIVHVLMDCCLKEKSYNPFYAYLGQKFCEYNRSYQVTFQYTFWDKLKVIDSLTVNSVQNMSFLLSHLIASKALSLSILKAVNFMELDKQSVRFFKHLFTHLLMEYPADIVRKSFERISSLTDLADLRQGMAIFIRHFIAKKKTGRSGVIDERIQSVIDTLHSSGGSRL